MTRHKVIISLATNYQPQKNLQEARKLLLQILSNCSFTRELWTQPINTPRPDLYLNQLARGMVSLSREQLELQLKDMERCLGRTDEDRKEGIVRIDLDLLQYDDTRYHLRDWERPYVQLLLT